MARYYANPYDTSQSGFYFDDLDDYEEQEEDHPSEEFEIEFIDGESTLAALFSVAQVNQANLAQWFELTEDMDDNEMAVVAYIISGLGYDLEYAAENAGEAIVHLGGTKDYVEEMAEQAGGFAELMGEQLEYYVDVEAVARDWEINGEIAEFTFAGTTYTIGNVQSL